MEPHENVDKMYCKCSDNIKYVELFSKKYILDRKNRKILNVLSKFERVNLRPLKKLKI